MLPKSPSGPAEIGHKKMATEGNCINVIVLTLPTWSLNTLINVMHTF